MALGIGMIGPGYIGRVQLRSFQAIPGASVVAIAARTRATAERVGEEFGIVRRYTDYRELLRLPEVQAVSICTPVDSHAEITLAAARAGKHVLCEKPMATTYADAKAMADACADAGVNLAICSGRARSGLYPLTGDVSAARVLVPQLGDLYYARVSGPWRFRGRPGLDILPDSQWFLDSRLAGGGVLSDLGCYSIDLLLHLTGDPPPVAVSAATFRGIGDQPLGIRYDVEEHASLFVRFAGGLVAFFEMANASHVQRDDSFSLLLCGSQGALGLEGIPFRAGAKVSLASAVPDRTAVPIDDLFLVRDQPGLQRCEWDLPPAPTTMFEDFVRACEEGRAPSASGDAGLKVMQVITMAYLSAAEGREVTTAELARASR
jgi:predicted dehydrogenase